MVYWVKFQISSLEFRSPSQLVWALWSKNHKLNLVTEVWNLHAVSRLSKRRITLSEGHHGCAIVTALENAHLEVNSQHRLNDNKR